MSSVGTIVNAFWSAIYCRASLQTATTISVLLAQLYFYTNFLACWRERCYIDPMANSLYDPETMMTRIEIERLFEIAPATFYNWKRKGKFGPEVARIRLQNTGAPTNCYSRYIVMEHFKKWRKPVWDKSNGEFWKVDGVWYHKTSGGRVLPGEELNRSIGRVEAVREVADFTVFPLNTVVLDSGYTEVSAYYDGLPYAADPDVSDIRYKGEYKEDSDLVLCPPLVAIRMST